MHLQIRSKTTASPPDLEKLLGRLADAGVNLAGAGGGDAEYGGDFAFAVDHDHRDRAVEVLEQHKYEHRVLEAGVDPGLTLCWLKNEPGELRSCIARVTAENRKSGRKIRDVLIGVPGDEGIPVQVYSD